LCCQEEFGRRESQTSRRFAPGPEGEKKQKMKSERKARREPFADSIAQGKSPGGNTSRLPSAVLERKKQWAVI
jgi:hypothetical protein